MMSTKTAQFFNSRVAPLIVRCCAVLVLATGVVAGQSRIIPPESQAITAQAQPTPLPSPIRPHVTTLRATDSLQGSRVALTSDQSLRDYEAYRRGDRFYVRIPGADVRRADAVRGKAFTDVRAQRTGDTTLVSFRLQPGATAHVEQSSNRLDIVIALPGATPAVAPADAGTSGTANVPSGPMTTDRQGPVVARASQNTVTASAAKPTPSIARPSPTGNVLTTAAQKPSPGASPAVTNQTGNPDQSSPSQSGWASFKERMHYWILLAQLNPIPVSIGVAILVLLIGLFVYRRRGRTTRGKRLDESKSQPVTTAGSSATTTPIADEETVPSLSDQAGKSAPAELAAAQAAPDNARQLLASQVDAEVRKALSGEDYDREIISSSDTATRHLVAAELLSALVGKNAERRERARNAFMDHGFFDDATRDLRIAESSNQRAAAARRLSLVRNREATPHLIAALTDSSSDVRRAATEALRDSPDPAAIAPLNALMRTETDSHVPRNLITQAIDACATSSSEDTFTRHARDLAGPMIAESSYRPEPEREVFEL